MPLYAYTPDEYAELRSFYERMRAKNEPERPLFPEQDYRRDAAGDFVKYEPATARFTREDLGTIGPHALVVYDALS